MTALDAADATATHITPLAVERKFTTEGVHPYDEVTWEKRDVVQKNWKTGETIFEQRNVDFPTFWSDNASTIVVTKYFRGAVNSPEREQSLRDLIDRVVHQYVGAAEQYGYFTDAETLTIFEHELTYMLLHQMFSFNSPVWFNVGTNSKQQVAACFILSVEDSMESILNWYREEGLIFKGGSGAGLNLSRIRSSKELLRSSGGAASGPVSFMRGADASAGTIKSGGATRRAAKMVVLDVDHPDIVEFVETKAREEKKIRALRDAGFDMDLDGVDITSVQYQNANNSVRVSDEFMHAVKDGEPFDLKARISGDTIETVDARTLFQQIAEAAWACADPGIQYDSTINAWHTNSNTGPITASNPCSEYLSLDNSSCNLASLNLMKFLHHDGTFDIEGFTYAVELIITAMDISICFADFPTEPIADTTRRFRQLGIGYANLGALLMAKGLAYDSADGRALAAAITSLMTATAYRRSAEIAGTVGAYNGYDNNVEPHRKVMIKHYDAAVALHDAVAGVRMDDGGDPRNAHPGIHTIGESQEAATIANMAVHEWQNGWTLGVVNGWRNAQTSVLAPCGTIGLMMDCDTTGIEPDFSLKKFKKLVGGGSMNIVNNQIPRGLAALKVYTPEQIAAIVDHVADTGAVVDAPHLQENHYPVFDCAAGNSRAISPDGHIHMMAAVQPFLSGAISKTVNLPETATVADIADVYYNGWALGLKAVAVYRDNCKVGQPLANADAAKKETSTPTDVVVEKIVEVPHRRRLPRTRNSKTISFRVGQAEGYITVGEYEDGTPGEIFLKMSKQGSTLAGVMDAFAVSISIGLQYGVPLETYVSKYTNQRFEPSGITDDSDIRMAASIVDYIFRRLALDYLPADVREIYGVFSVAERTAHVEATYGTDTTTTEPPAVKASTEPVPIAHELQRTREAARTADIPECPTCETNVGMKRAGACFCCEFCGGSTGCS